MDVFLSVVIAFALILINGYFSMSEMALVSSRRSLLQQEAEQGDKRAAAALALIDDSDKLLSTIQIFITLVGFGASAFATATIANRFSIWLAGLGYPALSSIAPGIAVVVTTLVVSYVTLVCGELVPKRMALSDPEGTAKRVAKTVTICMKAAGPAVSVLAHSTNGVARLLHIKSAEERAGVSEDEIKYLVAEQDTLLDEEKRMIHEIFDLGDTVAREVMTPRVDLMLIEEGATVREAVERMRGTGKSRLPVYVETPDRITGVVMVKDLLAPLMDDRQDDPIATYMRDPVFVPDTKEILPLLGEMQTSHQQMVVVVDEYGGTAGIITVEDIVEEIVGEIADEYDPDNKYLTKLSEREWLVDGRFPIDDAAELGWPVEESDEYETVAGWLLDAAGFVPQVGDRIDIAGLSFKVQSMRRRRVTLIRVSAPDAPVVPEGEEQTGADGPQR